MTITPFQTGAGHDGPDADAPIEGYLAYITQTAQPGYSWGRVGESIATGGPYPTREEAEQAAFKVVDQTPLGPAVPPDPSVCECNGGAGCGCPDCDHDDCRQRITSDGPEPDWTDLSTFFGINQQGDGQ